MRKLVLIVLSLFMGMGIIVPVFAEDYENSEKWTGLCSKTELTADEKKLCDGYVIYKSGQSETLKNELRELENQRTTIANNIIEYGKKIAGYNSEISMLAKEINELNTQISIKTEEIKLKESEILVKEFEVEALKQKVKERMAMSQSSMKLNQYIDVLMGATDLTDLLRRANGIKDISSFDQEERERLKTLIEELNSAKEQLVIAMDELEADKVEVTTKQNKIIVMKREVEIAIEESHRQSAELEAEGNRIVNNLEQIKRDLDSLSDVVDAIPGSSGFVRPVSGGRLSEGTWHYSSGGVHLGADFAPGGGVPIRAAGNGVVIARADGCPSVGGLGDKCGKTQGGSQSGGNQVYLLTKIDGVLYAVKYLHMQEGSPIAKYSVVSAGDTIGRVGSSGNSTGNHVHVEVFKLGNYEISDYIRNWNGDLAFGAEWSNAALNYLCENTGTPCRVKPESIF